MPHSARDSDDDVEPKTATGRMQTRNLTVQSVNSPLRRSSRIKQTKCSPGSESDSSSINSTQTARGSRTRTATVDSIVSDTKKLRTRKPSISSEISETMDVDAPRTPGKRTTRQSTSAATLGTPTRVNTRAASKRFMRAGSETKSPLPAARTTRRTRASSIDPESLSDQNKNQFDSPIKTRKRTSLLSSDSLVKEQIESEDRIPYVRLDATIVEIDEITSSEKVETSTDSLKSNETLQLEKETETQTEDVDRATVDVENKTLDEGQYCFEKTLPTSDTIDEVSIHDSSSDHQSSSMKEDKVDIIEENLSNVEKSLINTCESTKDLGIVPENLFDTSIEEEKSNKENQMLNIVRDVSTEKSSMQPNVTSYTKSLASPFMNKSSGEKEPKSKKERSLSKRRCSRESIEKAIKHSDFSKETVDNSQEMMDISIESSDSIVINKTILSQHDSIELVDKVIDKDETPIENISTSTCNENAEVISKSDKIDKIECIITDSKNLKKTELNEIDETSCSSTTQVKLTQRSNSRESLISNLTTDDNEIKLVLEEQSTCQDEVPSNVAHSKPDDSVDLQISLLVNESSDDRPTGIDKQSAVTQDEVIDRTDSTEQEQKILSKHITESASKSSNDVLETNNSACDDLNTVIQNNQFPDVKAAEDCVMDISLEKTDAKDISSKKIVKQNLKRKSSDVLDLEAEKESSQMDTSQKDQEKMEIADDVSDVNIGIDLFQNILADKWKEKNDVKTDSVQSTFQSVEDENEAECDLILVDKRAWLAAETIKAAKEIESFEYDSDDTVLLKSRSDAAQARYDAKKLDPVSEESLTKVKENEKQVKKQKPRTKKRLTSEIDQDSSRSTEDEDKSLNESKTALNRTNRFISKLNKSEQSARTRGRPSKANDESNEEIEDDASEFNRSPIISKRNTSLRKSEGRPSLNKSKDMQNISANKLRTDNSEEEFDTDAHAEQKLYKKKLSLHNSCNEDADDVIESEKKNISIKDNSKKDKNTSLNRSVNQKSKPINIKTTIHLNDDESDDSDINIKTMNLGSKAYSMIANAGSDVDCTDEYSIPSYIYATSSSSDDTDDNSCDSDINKEYNLDGVEPKFSDEDDVAADECRASETEDSDSDDKGSDLADFIDDYDYVDDYERYDYEDEVKVEEEEDDDGGDDNDNDDDKDDDDKDDDDQNMKEDDKNGNEQNVKEDKATEKEEMEDEEGKQAHIVRYTESINMESEDGEDDKNVQEKDEVTDKEENKFTEMETTLYASTSKLPKVHKSKDKSIEYISPHRSEREMKKSNIKKNEKTILLDSSSDLSNSDLSSQKKKKKSLVEENEINLLDTSNSISSSTKKKRKSNSQYFSGDGERNSSKQLNKSELMSTKRLSKSRVMEFSTPNLNTCKKLELDETFERISESEDIKLDNTIKTIKEEKTSVTKKKSKKDPILNKDINLKKFNYASKEKLSIRDLSPDLLELLHKTVSTSSKMELYKTMSICDSDTPTIKHLRKEKLNESAPILSNTETHRINSLWKELFTENMQHTAQRKIKEKNKDQVSHLITSNDDTIQKHSQKKQKKRNKQQTSKEDITDETLSEDAIELKIPKKKKRAKLTQLAIAEDDARKNTCQIIEKKKKQETSKENVTDEVLSEDAIELKIPKKKKRAKLTQLAIAEDNARKDTCQIIEKKKKQETSKENITDEVLSEDAIELKIPKKKKRAKLTQLAIAEDNARKDTCQVIEKKKKQETSKENISDEVLSEDVIELNIPKKKKRAKLTQLAIVEDNIREDACQINEKKKKKKKRETSKESITDKDLSEDIIELNVPKKKKYAKLPQLAIVEDNACEDTCQIIEKKKKKKKQETSKENITSKDLPENVMELKVPKKKKRAKLTQLAIVEDNAREDTYQITEKKKKKKQKTLNENIELYSEKPLSDIDLKISEKETRAILRQFAIVKDNMYKNQVNEKQKKKKKQETLKENITKKTLSEDVELKISRKRKRGAKPSQLDIVEDNTTTREDTYRINEKEKKKKKKRTNELAEQDNINKYNVLRKNICKSKTELAQHKKKNKIVDDLKLYSPADKQEKQIKKKIKQEETIENIEILRTEKKKKKNTVPVQIPVSKLRSERMSSLNILEQKTPLEMSELESTAYTTKILDEAIREAKRYLPKKLKPKKKRDRVEDIENVNVPTKKFKKHKEMNMFLPSSSGLKRLSDDVIENLTDVPTRAKKRKISRNEEQIVSKSSTTNKSKARTVNRDDAITLSTSGCTTQFQAVNLQNTKNQPSKEAASFKQLMLARNNRQPISAYMMYREKIRNAK